MRLGRRDRILVLGPPKTGTTALFYRIRRALPPWRRTLFEPRLYEARRLDRMRPLLAKVLLTWPDRPAPVRLDSFESFDRRVYLVRDPRDWLVSGTLFSFQQDLWNRPATLTAGLEMLRRKERDPSSVPLLEILRFARSAAVGATLEELLEWIPLYLDWLGWMEERSPETTFTLRYEDLVDDRLAPLEAHLGLKLEPVEVGREHRHVVRTKGYGGWRHWLVEEDVRRLRPLLAAYLRRHGYEDDWTLATKPTISPRHGSEYVSSTVRRRIHRMKRRAGRHSSGESLHVVKRLTAEAERSAELLHLLEHDLHEARRVFAEVTESRWKTGAPAPEPPASAYVLLLGVDHVLLTATSLEGMKRALDEGADIAVPAPIGELLAAPRAGLPSRWRRLSVLRRRPAAPPRTLAEYERLERRLLRRHSAPPTPPASQLPCALVRGALLRSGPEELADALTDTAWLSRQRSDRVADAGVYHRFSDYYGETRADVLPHLPRAARHILEVGCARGHTGALIQERLGCRVTGIELNPEIAEEAAGRLWKVIVGDVLDVELEGPFDAVVATELLEHLERPDLFLLRMRELVRPGGRLVLSVPNVGHHSVVGDLLAGRWDYLPAGLLCITHLRFFTRPTLERLLEQTGWRDHAIVPQRTELPRRFRRLGSTWRADRESLGTSGFLVEARR